MENVSRKEKMCFDCFAAATKPIHDRTNCMSETLSSLSEPGTSAAKQQNEQCTWTPSRNQKQQTVDYMQKKMQVISKSPFPNKQHEMSSTIRGPRAVWATESRK